MPRTLFLMMACTLLTGCSTLRPDSGSDASARFALRLQCAPKDASQAGCTALVTDRASGQRLRMEPFSRLEGVAQTRLRLHPVTGELVRLTLYPDASGSALAWELHVSRGAHVMLSQRGQHAPGGVSSARLKKAVPSARS